MKCTNYATCKRCEKVTYEEHVKSRRHLALCGKTAQLPVMERIFPMSTPCRRLEPNEAPAMASPQIPRGWASAVTAEGAAPYYWHTLTRVSQWTFPSSEHSLLA